jgi:hypothetical protein
MALLVFFLGGGGLVGYILVLPLESEKGTIIFQNMFSILFRQLTILLYPGIKKANAS